MCRAVDDTGNPSWAYRHLQGLRFLAWTHPRGPASHGVRCGVPRLRRSRDRPLRATLSRERCLWPTRRYRAGRVPPSRFLTSSAVCSVHGSRMYCNPVPDEVRVVSTPRGSPAPSRHPPKRTPCLHRDPRVDSPHAVHTPRRTLSSAAVPRHRGRCPRAVARPPDHRSPVRGRGVSGDAQLCRHSVRPSHVVPVVSSLNRLMTGAPRPKTRRTNSRGPTKRSLRERGASRGV